MQVTAASNAPPPFPFAEIRERLRALAIQPPGPGRRPFQLKLFAPYHRNEPYPDARVSRDIADGPDKRNLLDLFLPAAGGTCLPVFVFIPGGGLLRGERRLPGLPYYDNITLWAARHGMAGINVIHRVTPAHTWPACNEDMARLVGWIRANAAKYGLDAERIYMMGPSSGALIIANYIVHAKFHPPGGHGVAGAILISGAYDPHVPAYYGEDRGAWPAMSALPGYFTATVPTLVVTAEFDPPDRHEQAAKLVDGMTQHGKAPWFRCLAGHTHISPMLQLGLEPDDQLGDLTRDFLATLPP